MVNPELLNGRVYSYFAGIQQRFSDALTAEVNALGSYGRRLITTDIVNRDFSTPSGRYNSALPDIAYRSGQGFSDYNALAAVLRYRAKRGMAQVTYTWSHSIDNQSEPLTGDFFNLNFTSIQTTAGSNGRAAFSEQFDPQADRGDSDFDQRHNLVLLSYWNVPAIFAASKAGILFRDWIVSGLAAFRSGFPYTVIGTSNVVAGGGEILEQPPESGEPCIGGARATCRGRGRRAIAECRRICRSRVQHARQSRAQFTDRAGILQPRCFLGPVVPDGCIAAADVAGVRFQSAQSRESEQSGYAADQSDFRARAVWTPGRAKRLSCGRAVE